MALPTGLPRQPIWWRPHSRAPRALRLHSRRPILVECPSASRNRPLERCQLRNPRPEPLVGGDSSFTTHSHYDVADLNAGWFGCTGFIDISDDHTPRRSQAQFATAWAWRGSVKDSSGATVIALARQRHQRPDRAGVACVRRLPLLHSIIAVVTFCKLIQFVE
jgi:hypothetical protein